MTPCPNCKHLPMLPSSRCLRTLLWTTPGASVKEFDAETVVGGMEPWRVAFGSCFFAFVSHRWQRFELKLLTEQVPCAPPPLKPLRYHCTDQVVSPFLVWAPVSREREKRESPHHRLSNTFGPCVSLLLNPRSPIVVAASGNVIVPRMKHAPSWAVICTRCF
jgi:hypothetical protein